MLTFGDRKKIINALDHCLALVLLEGKSIDDAVALYPQFADELREELEAAAWIQQAGQGLQPRQGFRAISRRRLMQHIKAAPQQRKGKPAYRPILRLAFTLLLVLGVALTSTGLAAASALPGELLYPLKISIEETRLRVNQDDGKEIQLRLRFAALRVSELQTLAQQAELETAAPALPNYHAHVTELTNVLGRIEKVDHSQAQHLAERSAEVLDSFLPVLSEIPGIPNSMHGDFELAIAQTRITLEQIRRAFNLEYEQETDEEPKAEVSPDASMLAGNTPTPTLEPSASATPILTAETPTPEASITSAETATPAETPTPVATETVLPTNTPPPLPPQAPTSPPAQAPTSPPAASDNNKNDSKDNDPTDGNAGKGNDDKGDKTTGKGKNK